MGSGTMNDPSRGYHLELVCATQTLAADLRKMINSFVDLNAMFVMRKDKYIVYLLCCVYICETLWFMGGVWVCVVCVLGGRNRIGFYPFADCILLKV